MTGMMPSSNYCLLTLSSLVFAVTVASSSNASVVSVPIEHTYNLPDGFTGNLNDTFAQGTNVSSSHEISSLLQRANEAPIISFDDEFAQIVGSRPTIKLVEERNDIFAFEAGVWVPEKDQVWFTSSLAQGSTIPPVVGVLNLKTQAVWTLNGTSEPIINPNGGYYFDGKVYFGTYPSNDTYRGGIVSVDVETLEVETVVNSYFGIPFNGVDDIVWVTRNGKRQMFFTDLDISPLAYPDDPPKVQLPAGVWRFDPDEKMLQPVISRNELNPNGIRVSPDMKALYVTDSVPIFLPIDRLSPPVGPGAESWLGPYIYAYDLDENMTPANRRLFGLARRYFADGIHVDDVGRVWTGEGDGIVVRSSQGKTLGIFNGKYFLGRESEGQSIAIANFALAGDTVVVLAGKKLWTVQLSEEIVARDSSIIN